jgi:hypothetical protein
MRSPVSPLLTVLAGAVAVILTAAPASAHTSLIDVQPGEGDTVREGTIVSLTFSDSLLDLGTEISVIDSSGDPVVLDVQRPDPASVAATLPALAAGPVTVSWRVVAGDGHPIEGTLSYVAEGSEPQASEPASPSAPASAEPAPVTASMSSSPAPSTEPSGEIVNGGLSTAGWLGIGLVLLVATGLGVLAKGRR